MSKRIITTLGIALVLWVSSYTIHSHIIEVKYLTIPLFSVYLFHGIASVIIYLIVEYFFDKMPNQIGYLYLTAMCIKLGLFLMVFKSQIFGEEFLSKIDKVSLIVPLFIFLIFEGISIFRLLNKQTQS